MTETEKTEEIPSLNGVNVLIMGPAGTGKTHSIGTLVDAGIEVFYLALEAGLESLVGYFADKGQKPPPNLHWHIVKAPQASFTELLDTATKINMLSFDSLTKIQDPNRMKYDTYRSVLTALNDFVDQRTGVSYGPVNLWGVDRVIVIDGLSGLSAAALANATGGKPVVSQSDWGVAQGTLEKLLRNLCDACPCHFVLLAHVEREVDTVLGGVKLMASTLGKALAPKIPSMFSDVILSARSGAKWTWDTASSMADVKTRNLPMRSDIEPTFKLIIDKWQARSKAMQG